VRHLLERILTWFAAFGLPGFFVASMADAMGIPLSSELILLFTGFQVSRGHLHPLSAYLVNYAASLVGSSVAYWIGRRFGRPFILQYGRYLFITERHFARIEHWIERHGAPALLFARFIPGVRVLISYPAGIWRVPYGVFLGYSAIGYALWCAVGIYAGYLAGEHWEQLAALAERAGTATIVVLILLVVAAAAWFHFRPSRPEKTTASPTPPESPSP